MGTGLGRGKIEEKRGEEKRREGRTEERCEVERRREQQVRRTEDTGGAERDSTVRWRGGLREKVEG